MSQFFGRATRLNPPITIDGTAYGLALEFNQAPGDRDETIVASGVVVAVNDLGDGRKQVVCKREFQTDSFFVGRLDGGPREQVFSAYMGGNIAPTHEGQRLYSWANTGRNGRGDRRAVRPGDVLIWEGKRFLVEASEAFAVAPGEVDYTGGETFPIVQYFDLDFCELVCELPDRSANPRAALFFDATQDRAFEDAKLYETDGTAPLDRVIFARPDTTEDPEYFPDDAALAAMEFWVDPIEGRYRVGSGTSATGDRLVSIYYWRDIDQLDDASVKVIESEVGLGYGAGADDTDHVTVWSAVMREEGTVHVDLYDLDGIGRGAIEWRAEASADAVMFAVTFDGDAITGAYRRTTKGAGIEAVSFTAPANPLEGDPYFVRLSLVRSGGTGFEVRLTDANETDTLVASTTLSGVDEFGLVGVAAFWWDGVGALTGDPVKFQGLPSGDGQVRLGFADDGEDRGVVSSQRSFTEDPVAYSEEYGIDGSTAITEVWNIGSGSAMSESATARRDHYTKSGSLLTFTSESAGDRIRVTQAAPASAGDPPGFAPRVLGTVNFATREEGEIEATTVLAENRANWQDALVIVDLDDRMAATPGEAFTVSDRMVFDPRALPAMASDVPNAVSDWTGIDAGELYTDGVSGVVLVTETWRAAHSEVCSRASGLRVRSGNTKARQWNDVVKALESLDGLWLPVSVTGGGPNVSGWVTTPTIAIGSIACDGCSPVVGSKIIGLNRADFGDVVDDLEAAGTSWPYWHEATGGSVYRENVIFGGGAAEAIQYSNAANAVPQYCCPEIPAGVYDLALMGTRCLRSFVFPNGYSFWAGSNFVGCQLAGGTGLLLHPELQTAFNFAGIGFSAAELSKFPAGTQVLEARLRVRFANLRELSWSCGHTLNWETYSSPNAISGRSWGYINGVLVKDFEWEDYTNVITDVSETWPEGRESASIGFVLMGLRRRTRNAYLPIFDAERPVESGWYRSYGVGLTVAGGTADSDQWRVVNVANAIQALIDEARGDSEESEFFLWPTRAGVTPDTSDDGLAAYAQSLLPSQSITFSSNGVSGPASQAYGASGAYVAWENLQVGSLFVRVRLPNGAVAPPLILPPMMEAP